MISEEGVVLMSVVFKKAYPTVTYQYLNAKRCLLQMPAVAFRIKELYLSLMEKITGLHYKQLVQFLSRHVQSQRKEMIMKDELKQLFSITQNERERELIHYCLFKASGMTSSEVHRTYGLENMHIRAA